MSIPLRGRGAELAALREDLERLGSGVGTVRLIHAGPGLGKTRLLDDVARTAVDAGFGVGEGVAERADRTVQFAPLMDALLGGPSPLLDAKSPIDGRWSSDQRYWVLQDLEELLEQAALRRPILVCLDDLQWADSGTAAAIRSLPGRLVSLPIGWLLAYRPAETDVHLERAIATLRRTGAKEIALRPLDDAAVARLTSDVLGAAPGDGILTAATQTHGNPFLLIEMLSGLRDEKLIKVRDGRAELVVGQLPRRLTESIRRRLDRMSPSAQKVAAVGASMGRRFTLSGLSTVLSSPASQLLTPVAELIRNEVFIEAGGALSFSHDLVRNAVRAGQPSSSVQALDRQVAAALLDAGALPVEVATQLAASAIRGDELAITTLLKASDALAATDPGQAADLARRALDLSPDSHPLKGPLVARVAVLLHAAARTEEATAFADSALRDTLPADQEAQVQLGIAKLFAISPELRAEACRRALALPDVPADLRARLLTQLVYNLVVGVHPEQARELLEEARKAVDQSDDSVARFTLQLAESYFHYTRSEFQTALTLADAAVRSSLAAGDQSSQHLARNLRCGMLAVVDRIDEALAVTADGLRIAQQGRQAWALNTFEIRRGCLLFQQGRLADAATTLGGRYSPEEAHLVVAGVEAAGVVAAGRVALHMADKGQLSLTTSVAQVMLNSGIPKVAQHAAWLLALEAMAMGKAAQARKFLSFGSGVERLTLFPLLPFDPMDDPQLVRIAMELGDLELAESTAAAAQERVERNPGTAGLLASAAHARGLLTGDREMLATAVTTLEQGQRRLALGSALEDLAVAELSNGNPSAAIKALDRALVTYTECGASWDSGRVRRRLRQLGIRRRLAISQRPTSGWEALTNAELNVVRLIADGLSNRAVAERLYVSPHTVNGQLRQAFAKLGINSRVELARIAASRSDGTT